MVASELDASISRAARHVDVTSRGASAGAYISLAFCWLYRWSFCGRWRLREEACLMTPPA